VSTTSIAQSYNRNRIPSKLILLTGDTIECTLSYIKDVFMNPSVIYYATDHGKHSIRRSKVVKLHMGDKIYERIVIPFKKKTKKKNLRAQSTTVNIFFVEVIIKGKLTLYRRHVIEKVNEIPTFGSYYYIKDGATIYRIKKADYYRKIYSPFEKCPLVLEKIKKGEFTYSTIDKLIKYANANCK